VDPAGWVDRLEGMFGRVLAPVFSAGSRGCGPGHTCWAWCRGWSASTRGRWLSLPVTGRRTGCSGCWTPRS